MHYIRSSETTPPHGCTGNVEEPGAEEGQLCIFEAFAENATPSTHFPYICQWQAGSMFCPVGGASSKFGFGMETLAEKAGEMVKVAGSWAVTAAA